MSFGIPQRLFVSVEDLSEDTLLFITIGTLVECKRSTTFKYGKTYGCARYDIPNSILHTDK